MGHYSVLLYRKFRRSPLIAMINTTNCATNQPYVYVFTENLGH